MIKEKEILINITNRNKKYYEDKNYVKNDDELTVVLIEDISINSHDKITAVCDLCKDERQLMYYKYVQNYNRYNFYSCKKCSRVKANLTCNELYGSNNYMETQEGKDKYKKTCLNRYGVKNTLLVPEVQEKKLITNLERYGNKSPLAHPDIKLKTIATNNKKYGSDSFNQSIYFKNKIQKKWIDFYTNKLTTDYNIFNFKIITDNKLQIKCNICNKDYITTYKLLYQRTKLYNVCPCILCNPINNKISWAEQDIFNYVSDYTICEQTNKTILDGKHLDIYCKDINLAIEYNGVYWHCNKYKDNDFHFNKSINCINKNIKLYHIYETDWLNDKNDIKLKLKNYIQNNYSPIQNYKIINNELIINNNIIASIEFDNNYIIDFNCDSNYNNNIVFDIFIKELNLINHYYVHDNNNIFLDTTKFCFIKYKLPDYKYVNFNDKQNIKLYIKDNIETKYNHNDIEIINFNYHKIYDSGSTIYSLQDKHILYNNEMKLFLEHNNIDYFMEHNNYCFYTKNNMKYEICYIDSFNYSLNDIDKKYFYSLSVEAEKNNSFKCWIKDFEWDNLNQKDILKSYILHAANKTINKIYARDCIVKIIDNKTARSFEKENCFYGKRGASLNLGLILKKDKCDLKAGSLIMLYTFGHNFFAKKDGVIEVIRVGTLKYHSVTGGSSKLFNHFLQNYKTIQIGKKLINVKEIKFYSDYDHNLGNSLSNLNFEFIGYSKGGIMNYWVKENIIKHRQPMKHNEIKEKITKNEILVIPNSGVKIFKYLKPSIIF
jgi:hypothetical protein